MNSSNGDQQSVCPHNSPGQCHICLIDCRGGLTRAIKHIRGEINHDTYFLLILLRGILINSTPYPYSLRPYHGGFNIVVMYFVLLLLLLLFNFNDNTDKS